METSSEYTFPIFISSTAYNLIDLRAELSHHLKELGYRPILSSSEGFHDSFPDLEPWESCLRVLDTCFVMILVIDGRYGESLEWPHFANILQNEKISPTHAEYRYAHCLKKRMLVFVRSELMTHYQLYRQLKKKCGDNIEELNEILAKALPSYVNVETLRFIEEVKTKKPIPWIVSFDDVTNIKSEIQKKMLNELSELFLIKNKHMQTIITAFSRAMEDLEPGKRKELLQSIGCTKDLVDKLDDKEKEIIELKDEKKTLEQQIEKTARQRDKSVHIKKLSEINTKIADYESNTANFLFSNMINVGNIIEVGEKTIKNPLWTIPHHSNAICDQCKKIPMPSSGFLIGSNLNTCPKCKRSLCDDCWGAGLVLRGEVCSSCSKK